ncbi:MAG: LemA family protein [bacterium]|nr:LemA family protein [bacterium]
MEIIWIILGVIVLWLIFAFNSFVRLVNRVKEAWADIEVQLKRRYDLIPNLVEAVKGYAAHEEGVFKKVTEARAQALSAQSVGEKGKADNMMTEALKSVFAVAEAYPQLRAVESFTNLQNELTDTENKVQAARRFYNSNVLALNTKAETFPSNLVAKIFNFQKKEFFELENDQAKEPVKVSF